LVNYFHRIMVKIIRIFLFENEILFLVDRTNTAAEIAQQALQNVHAQKQRDYTRQRRRNHSSSDYSSDSSSNQQTKRHRSTKTTRESEPYTTPDPSTFEWYPDVGYHFDKKTGFYFDAKSTYFYNPTTQKYMYWDPAKSNYIPVEDTATTATAAVVGTNETSNAASIESNDKAEKVKNAQKVAKVCIEKFSLCFELFICLFQEMEQWAKKEREKKEKETKRKAQAAAAAVSTAITTSDSASTSSTAAGASSFADIGLPSNRPTGGLISLNLMSSNSGTSTSNRPALLAAFDNPESDNDDNDTTNTIKSSTTSATTSTNILDASEEKLVDWSKLTCLLCQRQFDTREVLEKHLQMSNLHKVKT
jgi:RNA-binding protein 5/10